MALSARRGERTRGDGKCGPTQAPAPSSRGYEFHGVTSGTEALGESPCTSKREAARWWGGALPPMSSEPAPRPTSLVCTRFPSSRRSSFAYTGARREPVTAVFATQIELDGRDIAWIGGTKVKVTEVVLDKIAYGWSPEEIHFQHPHLSLAQIHGALTYYYENQSQLDAQIRHGWEESAKLTSQVSDADLRRKLSNLKQPF